MSRPSGGRSRREPCAKCGLPVFIAERLNVGKHLYHRTCFRCARCNSQLTLANYYETEIENQFCCETCPDEEQLKREYDESASFNEKLVLTRSLSDEEKSAGIQKFEDQDDYSNLFETALESEPNFAKNDTLSSKQSSEFTLARSRFIASQLVDSESDDSDGEAPDLPKSEPPALPKSEPPDLDTFIIKSEFEPVEHSEGAQELNDSNIDVDSEQCESCDSGIPTRSLDSLVHNNKVNDISDSNQPETAIEQLDNNKIVTKENKFPSDNENLSLVKLRMRLFENITAADQSNEKKFIHVVPSPEEERNSTGLDNKSFESKQLESDINVNDSLIGIEDKNIEDHTEQSFEETASVEQPVHSIIIISDDSKQDTSTASVIEISDSSASEPHLTKENEYPEDLNPFGDESDVVEESKAAINQSVSLNPFDDDDDNADEAERPSPKPAVRRKLIKVRKSDFNITGTDTDDTTPEYARKTQQISCNPFDEDDDEEENEKEFVLSKKVIPAPKISLNPFWSDGEEPEEQEKDTQKPVPLPRNSRNTFGTPEPKPRKSSLLATSLAFGSNTSISSVHSSAGPTSRKKKQAPKPPSIVDMQDSAHSSITSSPSPSVQHSPKSTPRPRKAKKAPLPPSSTSTPLSPPKDQNSQLSPFELSPISNGNKEGQSPSERAPLNGEIATELGEWEKEKVLKDEVNRNRQSQTATGSSLSIDENPPAVLAPNKSTYGKWKRRKGPAPSRPIPQRRIIKPLPIAEIKRELDFIEIQQQGLEKQGVRLEQIIREKCEGPGVPTDLDCSLAIDVEDLILQLFELVNEKNELFRKQTELMYLRRQQRLEEEYADLEYQIRCLMMQPEANKTDSDKAREEELINRLVEVVERRNEIVECLEMDRVREAEEDDSINIQLNLYTAKREDQLSPKTDLPAGKQKKKTKKEKKFKFKSSKKVDVDKDIDECELSNESLPIKDKEKKKKKFNIF